uniref:Gustatory receptor n=1 Tax=Panagrolaimus sp. PS1159 TaxID=55785 RepID=A0AC35G8X8_9BILA
MIWFSWKKYPFATYSSKPISHIMRLFLCIATAITLYGYFNHIATERIYWQFDFVLHYKTNKEVENIQDCFYIIGVMVFLLVLLNYLLRVAPVVGIPLWFKCVLLVTLFFNAAQKWIYESIEAHMEMCEELNKNDTLCNLYIHYDTSTKSLSKLEKWLYYATKGLTPLTYTITMELFIACMAIVVHLSHERGNTVPQNIPRMVLRTHTI